MGDWLKCQIRPLIDNSQKQIHVTFSKVIRSVLCSVELFPTFYSNVSMEFVMSISESRIYSVSINYVVLNIEIPNTSCLC